MTTTKNRLRANFQYLMGYLGIVFDLVLLHNAAALTAGYQLALWARLPVESRQTLALETGIQNSGLGLILIFNFFDGLGGWRWWPGGGACGTLSPASACPFTGEIDTCRCSLRSPRDDSF